jgi:hypothetical protein
VPEVSYFKTNFPVGINVKEVCFLGVNKSTTIVVYFFAFKHIFKHCLNKQMLI